MAVSIQNATDFLDYIEAGDENWVSHHTPENKRQSMQWRHTLTNSEKIQNLAIKTKNYGNLLLGQEGAISRQFFASRRHHQCCCVDNAVMNLRVVGGDEK
jgi:uncharacterized membrane-anchored protein